MTFNTFKNLLKEIGLFIWYVFLFVFFVGGAIGIAWDVSHRRHAIDRLIEQHRHEESP